jgi:hypothetical protein
MTTRSAFTVLTVSSAFAASIAVDVSGCYAQQLRRDVPAEIIRPNPADAPPGERSTAAHLFTLDQVLSKGSRSDR